MDFLIHDLLMPRPKETFKTPGAKILCLDLMEAVQRKSKMMD